MTQTGVPLGSVLSGRGLGLNTDSFDLRYDNTHYRVRQSRAMQEMVQWYWTDILYQRA